MQRNLLMQIPKKKKKDSARFARNTRYGLSRTSGILLLCKIGRCEIRSPLSRLGYLVMISGPKLIPGPCMIQKHDL